MEGNGASINFMVGTSKRVKQCLDKEKTNVQLTRKRKEKRLLNKKKHVSKLKCYNFGKKGHLHETAKSPRR